MLSLFGVFCIITLIHAATVTGVTKLCSDTCNTSSVIVPVAEEVLQLTSTAPLTTSM